MTFRPPAAPSVSPLEAAELLGADPGSHAAGSGRAEAASHAAGRASHAAGVAGSASPLADRAVAPLPDGAPLLVDVRERDEYLDVRAPMAVLYPISSLVYRFAELPRDRPLLVICAHGERSQGATAFLLRQGFPDVRSVTGGLAEWLRAGLPYRRGSLDPGEGLLEPDAG